MSIPWRQNGIPMQAWGFLGLQKRKPQGDQGFLWGSPLVFAVLETATLGAFNMEPLRSPFLVKHFGEFHVESP